MEYSEYEAVVLATISCIQEAGASIVSVKSAIGTRSAAYDLAESTPGHRVTARGKILYSAVGNSDFDPDLAKRVRDCKLQSAAIESIWSEHVAPDENERREMRKMTSECLRALGHEAPDSPSDDDLARIAFPPDGKAAPNQAPPEWFEQCELQTALAFDVS